MASQKGSRLYYSPSVPISQQSEEQKLYYEFVRSIYSGDEVAFDAFVDQLEDVNKNPANDSGWTPIMHAAHKNRIKFVEKLINRGAKTDIVDPKNNRSLLHNACEHGYTELVKFLLEKEININSIDNEGESPLWTACRRGYDDIVQLLLNYELCNHQICDINVKKKQNEQSCLFVSCDRGYTKIVQLLLDYKYMKINIDDTDSSLRTSLIRACTKSHIEIVKLLLKYGANVNALNSYQQNCLLVAFRINKPKICKILLNNEYGDAPDLWRADKKGKYILDYKTAKMDKKIVSQIEKILHTVLKSAIQEYMKELPISIITVICHMTY